LLGVAIGGVVVQGRKSKKKEQKERKEKDKKKDKKGKKKGRWGSLVARAVVVCS
jgi:hypothetical protein